MRKFYYCLIGILLGVIGLLALLFLSFTSCSHNDVEHISNMSVKSNKFLLSSMYIKTDYPPCMQQITVSGTKRVYFMSEDENVAFVNEKGSVVGVHVGKTTIKVQGDSQTIDVDVEVVPKYLDFIEPIHDFSLTKNDLLSKLGNSYEMQSDLDVFYYRHGGSNPTGEWYFFNRDGILASSYIIMNKSKISKDDLRFFMRERYTYNVVRGAYIGYMDGHIFL